ncbi:hypothetical protein BY996DRAFT_4578138 [Phakopsora pachyrhizi]|uniref:3beta-hydroxysteroid 3-dehydrogenase n=1 Tax=Phakopsora pachyrhizi TaxID=170000 RepID=A0AAV0BJC8_PHAPC|nr:hypothetical protein BY996DRAFT_4578138 [Phakopsora pachyrhizi]CAH7687338.1 hypothetical protein PPACK8108_LOCUS22112 [Phakopsora pachyrhizi]
MSNKSSINDPRFPDKPVILITGATGAVGYGICLRLLYQLSQPIQDDLSRPSTRLKADLNSEDDEEEDVDSQSVYATPNGVTILIGCRNQQKGEFTRSRLMESLKKLFIKYRRTDEDETLYSYIDQLTGQLETMSFESYRKRWLDNLTIEGIEIDLYRAQSVIKAVKEIDQHYGYLTHLILNAGGGPFVGIDWLGLIRAFIKDMVHAVTYPNYMIESKTVSETIDHLPETWQLNVFSHYLLANEALTLLSRSTSSAKARIIWTGSLDGQRSYFDRLDCQCFKTGNSYQSSKYQVEILGQGFASRIQEGGFSERVTSTVAHPGVVAGNMFLPIIGQFMDWMMKIVFYFTRTVLGSPNHIVDAYSAALVWSYLCLAERISEKVKTKELPSSIRYGVQCNRWGDPIVVVEEEKDQQEVEARIIDQRIVFETCDKYSVALRRIWEN